VLADRFHKWLHTRLDNIKFGCTRIIYNEGTKLFLCIAILVERLLNLLDIVNCTLLKLVCNFMSDLKIDSKFCFTTSEERTIESVHSALKNYADKFPAAFKLDKSIPIILDTNVLLAYYGLSQVEKEKLIKVLDDNKDRIFLTSQIEKEFLRNRIKVINNDFFNPLKVIHSNFSSTYKEIKNKFKSFMESNKKLLSNDYPSIWASLIEKQNKLNEIFADDDILSEDLAQAIKVMATDNKNIYVVDKLLEVCAKFKIIPPLSDEEVKFIEGQYDNLWDEYDKIKKDEPKVKKDESNERKNEPKVKKDEIKREIIFPGCGDKGNKDYPYGDFIIFHEILKFMAGGKDESDKTDVIFLTYDKEKGDWIHSDLSPIIHYIEKVFFLTHKTLFIIHAEEPLKISFENIHKSTPQENDLTIRESTILTLNLEKQWGFISCRTGNLYFNPNFMQQEGEFYSLAQNDVVQYLVGKNQNGEDIAVNVTKVVYSFEDETPSIIQNTIRSPVFRSTVCSLDKEKGYGFILAHPENLYFHSTYLKDPTAFYALKVGSTVEYIVGLNEFGEDIARLVREVSLPQNELNLLE
jgi:cold shock CspA family protein